MATPLERPSLPSIDAPLTWPTTPVVAVFGLGEDVFAEALVAARADASLVRVSLRHAPGFALRDDGLVAHPSALVDGLRELGPPSPFVVGVGAAFAIAVRSNLTVWISAGQPRLALPPPLRAIAGAAGLVLEEARVALAAPLAGAL